MASVVAKNVIFVGIGGVMILITLPLGCFVDYQFLPQTGKEGSKPTHRRHQNSKQKPAKPLEVSA